ncbi:GNAT family N-acetyltransferase [Nanoarchaeota archaeon]
MTEIKKLNKEQLKELIPIYKETFKVHNIFEQEDNKILEYLEYTLEKTTKNDGCIFGAIVDNKIVGALILSKFQTGKDNHSLWKFRHVAIKEDQQGKGVGSLLIAEAEKELQNLIQNNKIKTAKIEITVSENEVRAVEFYEKNGFKVEGSLTNHYRWNETTFLLGKSVN